MFSYCDKIIYSLIMKIPHFLMSILTFNFGCQSALLNALRDWPIGADCPWLED